MQEKRKIPKFPNGAATPGEPLKEEAHHAGPELQRTGRWVEFALNTCSFKEVKNKNKN